MVTAPNIPIRLCRGLRINDYHLVQVTFVWRHRGYMLADRQRVAEEI